MLLIIFGILASIGISVTQHVLPPQPPYAYRNIYQPIGPGFIGHPPDVYDFIEAPPYDFFSAPQTVPSPFIVTPPGSSVLRGFMKFLVAVAAINRVITRNNRNNLNNLLTTTETPAFFSASLSNCGQTGPTGPTLSQCRSSYNTDWSNDLARFNVMNGVQMLTIPETGRYRLEAYGAEGGTGNDNSNAGGKGATMIGEFVLNLGTVLNIVIGQKGVDGQSMLSGGGGGGTFVYTGNIGESGLLLAAAGGGGGGEQNTRAGFDGQAGVEAINHLGLGGNIGNGGNGGVWTSAGAGWGSDGGDHLIVIANPGTRWNGGDIANTNVGDGGFGGGGSGVKTSGDANGGGGGGGYTGGDGVAAGTSMAEDRGGGGGGSFNAGTSQQNQTGNNSGHGRLEITRIANI